MHSPKLVEKIQFTLNYMIDIRNGLFTIEIQPVEEVCGYTLNFVWSFLAADSSWDV